MKHYRIILMLVLIIGVFLCCYREGNATESTERWTPYGQSEMGIFYYNNKSVKNIKPEIIDVLTKIKYSKLGKEKTIQARKDYELSVDGWEKLDYCRKVYEIDCINNTSKLIKKKECNIEGKTLAGFEPNPTAELILHNTIMEDLRKMVCTKQ